MHALKYQGWSGLAFEVAARLARLDLGPLPPGRRVLVPVPLAPKRLRERGYNQSECLASAIARHWGAMPPLHLVERIKETPTQTQLTPDQRLHNVANAFRVDTTRVPDMTDAVFFLVDDIVTTGATLNACAEALAGAGARTICYLTFGRARDPRDTPLSPGTTSHGYSGRN